jgi:hypothetical protein
MAPNLQIAIYVKRIMDAIEGGLGLALGGSAISKSNPLPVTSAMGGVTPTLYNATLTLANTEYSQALAACKGIEFQARTAVDIRFAFVTGKVATPTAPYMTLKAGQWYIFDGSPTTLYLASATAGTVVEIIVWS